VLNVEFSNRAAMVINRHAVAREIWVAGRRAASNFRYHGSSRRDIRNEGELFVALSKLVSAQGGQAVRLD
jgi:CyaY protein